MSAYNFFKLSLFLTLVFDLDLGLWPATLSSGAVPPTCSRIECPKYDLIHAENDQYEIRRYNSVVLVSTSAIEGKGIVEATKTDFKQ